MKLGTYFLRKARAEKKNIAASTIVYFLLLLSLEVSLGLSVEATKGIYFQSNGFLDDCYYSVGNSVLWNDEVPDYDQGFVWDVTTYEEEGKLIYKAKGSPACAEKNLGYLLTSRVYLYPQAHDFTKFPQNGSFSITYNVDNPKDSYADSSGVSYPRLGKGTLLENDSLLKQVKSMGFNGYGFVAMIADAKDSERSGMAVIRGHADLLNSAFRSGKALNEQHSLAHKSIPLVFYVGLLLPSLFEVVIAFGIISSLNRKGFSDIYALRLIGAKRSQCFLCFFLPQLCELLCAFLVNFAVSYPILLVVFPGFAFALSLGEIIIFLYASLCVLASSNHGCRLAFSSKERKNRYA